MSWLTEIPLTRQDRGGLQETFRLSDEALVANGLQRNSMVENLRFICDLSGEWHTNGRLTQFQARTPNASPAKRENRMILNIPNKVYTFKMLRQMITEMSFEKQPEAIFKEQELALNKDYREVPDEEARQMTSRERLDRRLKSFYDHLEDMFVGADLNMANMAVDLVFNGISRLAERRNVLNASWRAKGYTNFTHFEAI
ncbi:uncharacterized protein LOC6524270 [Drosophila yakuba]|uniref:Uncharacterized protein n=1 Tax=Drosophila yakuba TaxID=7245 RepID=B4Q0F7_DROYA|nr:uncharacterized protein LOC6524270 [Drosophila yakuba]EDX01241.1 uncharacterized protein Dyak_GE16329 [Drosophila yakuba]